MRLFDLQQGNYQGQGGMSDRSSFPRKWAKHQPKDGDSIMVCNHPNEETYHWYLPGLDDQGNPARLQFKRADGSTGQSAWICICDACNQAYSNNPKAAVRRERLWTGDAPVIPDLSN